MFVASSARLHRFSLKKKLFPKGPFVVGVCGYPNSKISEFCLGFRSYTPCISILQESDYLQAIPSDCEWEKSSGDKMFSRFIDWELLEKHIETLCLGQPIWSPKFDMEKNQRLETQELIIPGDYVLVKGHGLFAHADLLDSFDCRLFLEKNPYVQLPDIKENKAARYVFVGNMQEWIAEQSKYEADLVVPFLNNYESYYKTLVSFLNHKRN